MDLFSLARELNPWWTAPPRPPLFVRDIVPELVSALQPARATEKHRRALILSGLRQVGKSTALKQAAARLAAMAGHPEKVMYFDLGDPRVVGVTIEDLLAHTGFLAESADQKVLLLDEVAHDPNWTESIKRLVDLGERAPGLLAADSAAARLRTSAAGESALGRRTNSTLEPLSFAEFARSRGMSVTDPRDADGFLLGQLADEYLLRGGMPEHVFSEPPLPIEEVHTRLRRDAEYAVSYDAPRVREVREVESLRQVWSMLARGISLAPNISRLCTDLGISKQTLTGLIGLLRDILFVRELPVYGKGPKAPLRHPPRLIVADCGLAAAHLLRARLRSPEEQGLLVEAAVARHLAEFIEKRALPPLAYARYEERGRTEEVDFVVELPDPGAVALETKYGTEGNDDREIRRLAARARIIGAHRALLVTRHPALRRSTVDGMAVDSVPLWRFLCWPGSALQGELES